MGRNKIIKNIARCKCCLGEDKLKDLWTERYNGSEREIYGVMLSDCFALNWKQPTIKSDSDIEHICSTCVFKLYAAVSFKKEILMSAQLLLEEIKNESCEVKMEDDSDTDIETEYLNIDYLEDEDIGKEKSDIKIEALTKPIQELYMSLKSKTKNYTEEDFKKCLEAVKSKTLSQYKASLMYNVPRWTIRNALNSMELQPTKEIDKELNVNLKSEWCKEDVLKNCVEVDKNKSLLQKKVSKLLDISRRTRHTRDTLNTLEMILPSKEKNNSQDKEIIDGDNNIIESTKESGSVTRKRKKGYTEVKVEKLVEAGQKDKHKEVVARDSKVLPLSETIKKKERKQKKEEIIESDDNSMDSLKLNKSFNVSKKKNKNYTEADLQKCVEAVRSNRLSQCKASIMFNVPRQAIHIAVEKSKLSSSSVPLELIKPNQSKLYTEEDFKKCLEAVKNKTMTRVQASKTYNVPTSSLFAAISKYFNEADKKTDAQKAQENVDCVINYTNATPFSGFHRAGYACLFCSKIFEEPAHLKIHTLKTHSKQRAKVRPSRALKLDVTDLKCEICDEKIETLESVLQHLKSVHGKEIFTGIREFFVPFKFESEVLKCAVCSEAFHCFKLLNDHMNSNHFKNFECNECGRGFISKHSLREHRLRHETGVFKCKFCPKEFTNKVRTNAHERTVHIYNNYLYTCGYCSERFSSLPKKKQHEVTKHNTAQTLFKCKACSKSYQDLRALRTHVKAFHLMMRPHKCEKCDFSAYSPQDLKKHMTTHTGEKNFICDICSKSFGVRSSIREHLRIHANDRRFKCEHCGQSFVQKCAWKTHILTKHGEPA